MMITIIIKTCSQEVLICIETFILHIKYEHFALFRWSSSQQGKMTILETKQSVHTLLVPHIRSNISTVMVWYHGNKRTTT